MAEETFRQRAAECVRLAQLTNDAESKALLLKMAEAWLRVATSTESPWHQQTPNKSKS
jgi:hypothetical protein